MIVTMLISLTSITIFFSVYKYYAIEEDGEQIEEDRHYKEL